MWVPRVRKVFATQGADRTARHGAGVRARRSAHRRARRRAGRRLRRRAGRLAKRNACQRAHKHVGAGTATYLARAAPSTIADAAGVATGTAAQTQAKLRVRPRGWRAQPWARPSTQAGSYRHGFLAGATAGAPPIRCAQLREYRPRQQAQRWKRHSRGHAGCFHAPTYRPPAQGTKRRSAGNTLGATARNVPGTVVGSGPGATASDPSGATAGEAKVTATGGAPGTATNMAQDAEARAALW